MKIGFVDAHSHLVHEAYSNPQEYIEKAKAAGLVAIFCTTGMKAEHSKVLALCAQNKGFLYPVIGISPYDAVFMTDFELENQLLFIENYKRDIVAIGEIGMDFHHFTKIEEQKKQERVFRAQLELARKLHLPVVMHTRKAEVECFEIFKEYEIPGVFHCFLVHEIALKAAAVKSFKVLVSIPTLKNKNRDRIILDLPLESLICETDAPYLWPSFPSEPANVVEVYRRISEKKQISLEKVKEQIFHNVNQFFKLGL